MSGADAANIDKQKMSAKRFDIIGNHISLFRQAAPESESLAQCGQLGVP